MNRFLRLSIASLGLLGCNQPSPPAVPDVTVVATPQPVAVPQPAPKVEPPAPKKEEPPKNEEPPSAFPFPTDAAGKLLPKVVAPQSLPLPAVEKFGSAAKPRPAPAKLVEPDPLAKMHYAPPPLLPAKSKGIAPAAPAERVPFDLGVGAAVVPAKPAFAEAPGIAVKARDAKLPPDLAPLGRQLADRASLDDPTAEPGNAIIVSRTPMPAFGIAAFLKIVLPDPFEFAEQVKPKVLPAAEPSLVPVLVNPQRVK